MRSDNMIHFRLDGRPLARGSMVAVLVATILSATTAQAVVLNFQIIPEMSTLGFDQYFTDSYDAAGTDGVPYPHIGLGDTFLYLGPIHPDDNYGNPDPSNVAPAMGTLTVDVNAGVSLKILSSNVTYAEVYPYYPWKTNGVIQAPPNGDGVGGVPGKLAQFGLEVYGGVGIGPDQKAVDSEGARIGLANIYDLTQTFGTLSTQNETDGGAAMPWEGGFNYGAYDLALFGQSGFEDIWSSAIVASASIDGVPTPIGGNFGGANEPTQDATALDLDPQGPVTWDGIFLTIPVNNRIVFESDGILYDITTFGQIVAQVVVPEPSSVMLLGAGAIGLVACIVRRRRASYHPCRIA